MQNSVVSFPINITNFFRQYPINHYSLFYIYIFELTRQPAFFMRVTSLPYQITGFLHIIVANVDKKRKGTIAPSRVRKLRVKLVMMNFLVSESCVPVVYYLITPSIHFYTLFSLQCLPGYTLFIFKFRSQLDSSESDRYIINANFP